MKAAEITFMFIFPDKKLKVPVEVVDSTISMDEILKVLENNVKEIKLAQLHLYIKDKRNESEVPISIRNENKFLAAKDVFMKYKGVGWKETEIAEIIIKKQSFAA